MLGAVVRLKERVSVVIKKRNMRKSHELTLGSINYSPEAMDMFASVVWEVNRNYNSIGFVGGEKRDWNEVSEAEIDSIPKTYNLSREQLSEIWSKSASFVPDPETKDKRRKITALNLKHSAEQLMQPIGIRNTEKYKLELVDGKEAEASEKTGWVLVNIIEKASYTSNGLDITLTKSGIELITNESKGFAQIDLYLFFKLKGRYAKRLLEILTKTKSNIPYTIGEIEKMLGSDFSSYSRPSAFLQTVLERPLKELIETSKAYQSEIGGAWVCGKNGKGFTIKRARSNRTSVNDIIHFQMKFLKDVNKPSKSKDKTEGLQAAVELSDVAAKWFDGIAPTASQAMEIKQSGLMEEDIFNELASKFPPTW